VLVCAHCQQALIPGSVESRVSPAAGTVA